MSKWLVRALPALLLALGGCGGDSDAAPGGVPPVTPGAWAVLGSSTAAGAGAPVGQGWVALLQAGVADAGVSIHNLALGGYTTYHALPAGARPITGRPGPAAGHNLDRALALGARALLVAFPSNDSALGYNATETVANLLAIRAHAQQHGLAVLVLSTQPRALAAALRARLVEIDARLAPVLGACFVAVHAALAAADGRLAPHYDAGDGVHPNAAGHALIATLVRGAIDGGACLRLSAP